VGIVEPIAIILSVNGSLLVKIKPEAGIMIFYSFNGLIQSLNALTAGPNPVIRILDFAVSKPAKKTAERWCLKDYCLICKMDMLSSCSETTGIRSVTGVLREGMV
jgi:hypothetical protein